MAAAPQPSPELLTLEEYLQTSYHPDCDFVDGHLEERNVGEYEHSTLQIAIGSWFFNRRKEWKIRVGSEYRTRVGTEKVRIPDISVFSHDGPSEKVRVTPPIVAIEILSPEDRLPRVIPRLKDFVSMGVPNVWLIDPFERVGYAFEESGLRLIEGDRLEAKHSPIYLDLSDVFSALD
jgi:Uma2 family endonuclease